MASAVPKTFYGEDGENFLLFTYFELNRPGFYVDIGAFDGRHCSTSLIFEQLGREGLCVEAHPDYFPLLQGNRPGACCIEGVVTVREQEGGTATIHTDPLGLATGRRQPDRVLLAKRYGNYGQTLNHIPQVDVPAFTLEELLTEHAPDRRVIDLLILNTHGTAEAILRVFSAANREIRTMIVRVGNDQERSAVQDLMKKRGMSSVSHLAHHLVFLPSPGEAKALQFRCLDCTIADTVHPVAGDNTPARLRGREMIDCRFHMAPHVLHQQGRQPLASLLDFPPAPFEPEKLDGIGLVHGLNLFAACDGAPDSVQNNAVSSMTDAAENDRQRVRLFNIQHRDDPDLTPPGFNRGRDLERTATDLESFQVPRPLPVLFDVLNNLADQANEGDYLIYTNADIGLRPSFYRAVRELIAQGFHALIINRRTIAATQAYAEGSTLPLVEIGMAHRGYDCFVFSKKHFRSYIPSRSLIGVAAVDLGLFFNMFAFSQRMAILRNVALTHHFGDDQRWNAPDQNDYRAFNSAESRTLFKALIEHPEVGQRMDDYRTSVKQRQAMRQRAAE
ncbi:MAG: hypothetical protein HOL02_11435 [Rhodospirillaceae bacterium]|nr:hypothetical protein [Rhodospirillaceae bacterium]